MTDIHRLKALAGIWLVVAAALAASVPAAGQPPRAHAVQLPPAEIGVDLAYHLAIDDPDSGLATVTRAISSLSTDTFGVEESGYHGLYVNFLSTAAYDAVGNPLPVEHLPDSGTIYFDQAADVWRVAC